MVEIGIVKIRAGGRKPDSVRTPKRPGGHFSHRLAPAPRSRGMRLIPGMCPARAERPGRAVIPVLSCTARGLSCHDDHSPRGGLLPRLFNLTCRGRRYIFCDTIRGGGLASVGPALARGVLPRGVRTFLYAGEPRSGHRPPAGTKLCHPRFYRNLASQGRSLPKAETWVGNLSKVSPAFGRLNFTQVSSFRPQLFLPPFLSPPPIGRVL